MTVHNPLIDVADFSTAALQFFLGLFTFPLLFYSLVKFFTVSSTGSKFCGQYGIRQHGIYDISNKITSSIFSILSALCGFYVISQCQGGGDLMKQTYPILDNFLTFGLSYFFYDLVSMYMVSSLEEKNHVTWSLGEVLSFCKKRPVIILHHICVPMIGYNTMLFLRSGQGDCILGGAFLMESSTPFVSMRVILCHLNMRSSSLYVVNGLAMLFTFFVCRILVFPCMYVWYGASVGLSMWQAVASLHWFCHAGVIALTLPQLFWFTKMVKGSIKIIGNLLVLNKQN